MEHPIRVVVRGRTVGVVHHPSQAIQARHGRVVADQRGGHVLPARPVKRAAFRLLRGLFGYRGRVAEWTRGWSGDWMVFMTTGERLGPFGSHAEGVAAEVDHVVQMLVAVL